MKVNEYVSRYKEILEVLENIRFSPNQDKASVAIAKFCVFVFTVLKQEGGSVLKKIVVTPGREIHDRGRFDRGNGGG